MVVLASRINFSKMFYDINEYTNINTLYNYKIYPSDNRYQCERTIRYNRTFE